MELGNPFMVLLALSWGRFSGRLGMTLKYPIHPIWFAIFIRFSPKPAHGPNSRTWRKVLSQGSQVFVVGLRSLSLNSQTLGIPSRHVCDLQKIDGFMGMSMGGLQGNE